MIKAVAIDDEPLALNIAKAFCEKIDYIDLVRTFTEAGAALKFLKEHPVDLLFLDINMPVISGIEFYKMLPGDTIVIFTTAHSQYAVEGYNLNAIDYLLKPFEFNRFQKACEKAKDYLDYVRMKETAAPQHIFLRVDYSMTKVMLADIQYIEGLDNYIKIHFVNGKTLLVRMSMKGMIELLPANEFIRVHRSYIIPKSKVTAERSKTIFLGTIEIPVGTNYVEEVQQLFRQKGD
jgi:DNA-binding LytR/AlgR family response regulator